MPSTEIPEGENQSSDTSLDSSIENVLSTRSTSSSEDIFIGRDAYPDQIFNRQTSIRLAQMTPQCYQYEPKLDDLLVMIIIIYNEVNLD